MEYIYIFPLHSIIYIYSIAYTHFLKIFVCLHHFSSVLSPLFSFASVHHFSSFLSSLPSSVSLLFVFLHFLLSSLSSFLLPVSSPPLLPLSCLHSSITSSVLSPLLLYFLCPVSTPPLLPLSCYRFPLTFKFKESSLSAPLRKNAPTTPPPQNKSAIKLNMFSDLNLFSLSSPLLLFLSPVSPASSSLPPLFLNAKLWLWVDSCVSATESLPRLYEAWCFPVAPQCSFPASVNTKHLFHFEIDSFISHSSPSVSVSPSLCVCVCWWVFDSVLFFSLHVFLLGRLQSSVCSFCLIIHLLFKRWSKRLWLSVCLNSLTLLWI